MLKRKGHIFKTYFIYLFLHKGEGREKERERNTSVWLFSQAHTGEPGPQRRHVPQPGNTPETLCFSGRHSVHGATPAGEREPHFCSKIFMLGLKYSISCSLDLHKTTIYKNRQVSNSGFFTSVGNKSSCVLLLALITMLCHC